MPFGLFRKDRTRNAARELYRDIILQSRQEYFYAARGVPDTVEGRFDMITLHMFLVLQRLKDEEQRTGEFAQALFDVMFKDMDHAFREMGVGDLKVGSKVRKLAEDFYGRIGAYRAALEAPEEGGDPLVDALRRNILSSDGDDDSATANAQALAAYMREARAGLSGQTIERLMLGLVSFPDPETVTRD